MFKKICLSIFGMWLMIGLQAQDESNILLKANVLNEKVVLNWFPTDAETWHQLNQSGYNLTRQSLDNAGNPTGSAQKLNGTPIFPKDTVWFNQQKSKENVVLNAIGQLMYDSTFQFPKTELLDPVAMKYNYSVYEAENDPLIAEGLGLMWVDETAQAGTNYRYTLTAANISILETTATLDILVKNFEMVFNMPEKLIQYDFPGGKPLSAMVIGKQEENPFAVLATAKAYGDSIVLRWAPNQAQLWLKANKDGYEITRVNLKDIQNSKQTFTVFPMEPDSIPIPQLEKDSFAMLTAGIMFGDTQLPEDYGFYDKANIFETQFGFGLYASERSNLAAEIMGLRFVDRNVELGEEYVYFIKTKETPDPMSQGYIEIKNIPQDIPTVSGFQALSQEKSVRLEWDKGNERKFNSYIVERSDDGGETYKPLTKKPIVFIEKEEFPLTVFGHVDSLSENYKSFKYRVAGYNAFNELSDFVEVEGQGVDLTPPEQVTFLDLIFNDSLNEFTIKWQEAFGGIPDDFKGYQVLMGENEEGNFGAVSEELPKGTTDFVLKMGEKMDVNRSYYFKIVAMDNNGNQSETLPKFADVPDLEAPEPPTDVVAKIDDEGKVEITWTPSIAKDIDGYWIYFNNNDRTEFSPVNTKLERGNKYSYYIEKKSLNEEIYFTMRSEDLRTNRGKTSEIIKVKRPDHVPPVKPFLKSVTNEKAHLMISWDISPSADVVKQILYRRNISSDDPTFVVVDSLENNIKEYQDKSLKIGGRYLYKLVAMDDAGNLSEFSNELQGKMPFPADELVIDFKLKMNKDEAADLKYNNIIWEFDLPYEELKTQKFQFDIYRAVGGNEPEFLIAVPSEQREFIDINIVDSVLYNYSVKVRFENGWVGKMSEIKSVLVR